MPGKVDRLDNSGEVELETIFHAEGSSIGEVEALGIKTLLESNGIPAVMVGDSVLPHLPFEIKVARQDAERARQLTAESRSAAPASDELGFERKPEI